ncbi:hypothetical protein, partial [uncultured Duncaniella sp.]|uniref:hypothetical protein n=1 Tax=uncultured Duncaniella sp. TaxID=2768039 RepID=UPI002657D405
MMGAEGGVGDANKRYFSNVGSDTKKGLHCYCKGSQCKPLKGAIMQIQWNFFQSFLKGGGVGSLLAVPLLAESFSDAGSSV